MMKSDIMVVEDEFIVAMDIRERLETMGYNVCAMTDSGEAAIEQVEEKITDLILMDMSLPGIDGWTATRQVKGDAATRSIPVIALTAHAMAGDREKALEAGCDDFDTKPVELQRLLGKIEALLGNG